MYEKSLKYNILFRLRQIFIHSASKMGMPFLPYLSYWHIKIPPPMLYNTDNQYFAAIPNRGAGIGHQLANWIAGYWFARIFELGFAHIPFSSEKWENFFEFGKGEVLLDNLVKQGYKVRRLPKFEENNIESLALIKQIIASYIGKKVVFVAEQDQSYQAQYGVMNVIKDKFYCSSHRLQERLQYNSNNYNIAIHIRRGDIMSDPNNPNLAMRFLANDYYEKILQQIIKRVTTPKAIHIYLFSQGSPKDYAEFEKFDNLHWCLDMSPQDSFAHMVFADLLITSKSSFSYNPALISNGIKVCPKNFWHLYPNTSDWIFADDYGNLLN